jgi:hypothetical protein
LKKSTEANSIPAQPKSQTSASESKQTPYRPARTGSPIS